MKKVSVDIIDHKAHHQRRWFSATGRWSYHVKRDEKERSDEAYEKGDDNLKGVCYFLHRFGVKTAASCEGHFYKKDFFEQMWKDLVKEKKVIKTKGLRMVEQEMNQSMIYYDKSFELPWKSFYHFYNQARQYVKKGYLGILIPRQQKWLYKRLKEDAYKTQKASITYEGITAREKKYYLFHVEVRGSDEHMQGAEWEKVAAYLKGCVHERWK